MSRDPRRSYDRDGMMIPPATVGSERRLGVRVAEIWCEPCVRSVEINTDALPDDLPIPDICLRYRCERCGGKSLSSRPGVCEHYRVMNERRRSREG